MLLENHMWKGDIREFEEINIAMVWKEIDTSILIELNSPFHFHLFSHFPVTLLHSFVSDNFISISHNH